ncbi:glycosyltransferase family 1 protein [Bacteroidota bacterium]
MSKQDYLHVVAFNVPYPPNYGGIIDIYFKLKALHDKGIKIILHAFLYGRSEHEALESITEKVFYYRRNKSPLYFFSKYPFIVISRKSEQLEKNLLTDPYPVLFEGLHSSFHMPACQAAGKQVFIRTHNIEHRYYRMLASSDRNIFRKLYLRLEAMKLSKYEEILGHASQILAISQTDYSYFWEKYGNALHVSAFHHHDEISCSAGTGKYILMHGNLSVPENENAVRFLIKKVLAIIDHRVIIAGKDPNRYLEKLCKKHKNLELVSNPTDEVMNKLVAEAHINLLYTFQPTGLKLKLLHSLYSGRFCMANPLMLSGSGLQDLCVVYRSPAEAIASIEELMARKFDEEEIAKRKKALKAFDNAYNADKIIQMLR